VGEARARRDARLKSEVGRLAAGVQRDAEVERLAEARNVGLDHAQVGQPGLGGAAARDLLRV